MLISEEKLKVEYSMKIREQLQDRWAVGAWKKGRRSQTNKKYLPHEG
jgi:hypothetical protein